MALSIRPDQDLYCDTMDVLLEIARSVHRLVALLPPDVLVQLEREELLWERKGLLLLLFLLLALLLLLLLLLLLAVALYCGCILHTCCHGKGFLPNISIVVVVVVVVVPVVFAAVAWCCCCL